MATSQVGNFNMPSHMQTVPSLTGNNYPSWSRRMQFLLQQQGLWAKHFTGREIPPGETSDAKAIRELAEEKAFGMLGLAVDPNTITIPKSITNPKELWDYLKNLYEPKNIMRYITLRRKLNTIKKTDDITMTKYVNLIEECAAEIADCGKALDDEEIACSILIGLPTQLDQMVMSFAATLGSKDKLSLDKVKHLLCFEDSRQKALTTTEENSTNSNAFVSRTFTPTITSGIRCFLCGGYGHGKFQCGSKVPDDATTTRGRGATRGRGRSSKRGRGPQRGKREQNSLATFTMAKYAAISAQATMQGWSLKDVLILDSGATGHMVHNRNWFHKIHRIPTEKVKCANKSEPIMTNYKGSIRFETNKSTITLEEVLYVPDLDVNLLSIRAAVRNGCKIVFDEDVCRIYRKKTRKLLAQGQLQNELYVLRGSPIDCLNAINVDSSTESNHKSQNETITNKPEINNSLQLKPSYASVVQSNEDAKPNPVKPNQQETEPRLPKEAILWHKRFMHVAPVTLCKINKNKALRDFSWPKSMKLTSNNCHSCLEANANHKPFKPLNQVKAKKPLEVVHSDVCEAPINSWGHSRYFLTFVDDYSRYCTIYFLKQKSEVLEKFKHFHVQAERETGCKLLAIKTDQGREYVNKAFDSYLSKHGIRHQMTPTYQPQCNGIAERINRTIVSLVRSTLLATKLPLQFWAELCNTAVYLRNRCTNKLNRRRTPCQLWHQSKRKPSVKHLKAIGCLCFALKSPTQQSKLKPRGIPCIMIGYDSATRSYRLWDIKAKRVINNRNVTFLEHELGSNKLHHDTFPTLLDINALWMSDDIVTVPAEQPTLPVDEDASSPEGDDDAPGEEPREEVPPGSPQRSTTPSSPSSNSSPTPNAVEVPVLHPEGPQPEGRITRLKARLYGIDIPPVSTFEGGESRKPKVDKSKQDIPTTSQDTSTEEVNDVETALVSTNHIPNEPNTFKQAMTSPDAHLWQIAVNEEYGSLIANGTWELVDLPPDRKPVDCKWVFKIKCNSLGEVDRYKARLVAKGFTQKYGVDYHETYSPVAGLPTIRLLLAAAVQKGFFIDQYDVKTAYLNGSMPPEEVVYMHQPEGFVVAGQEHKVCKLVKSLYGLKQSGRRWYIKFAESMLKQGMKRCKSDACVFVITTNDSVGILIVYVDDIAAIASNRRMRATLRAILQKNFEIKFLGPMSYMLGIRFTRNTEGTLCLDQEVYIKKVLEKFKMTDCKPVAMPAVPGNTMTRDQTQDSDRELTKIPLRELVGCLSYIANGTRPDICHAMNSVAQHTANPTLEDWTAAKRVLRYLQGTKEHKLVFKPTPELLNVFSDARRYRYCGPAVNNWNRSEVCRYPSTLEIKQTENCITFNDGK